MSKRGKPLQKPRNARPLAPALIWCLTQQAIWWKRQGLALAVWLARQARWSLLLPK
jgi:hypothetical protein